MQSNYFELIGRVNFLDIKYSKTGLAVLTVLLSKKAKEAYQSFELTAFAETAEKLGNEVKKGDYIRVIGYLNPQEYIDKNDTKQKKMQLAIQKFEKVTYDEKQKQYVSLDADEVPW
jgi:single-stranded DNA-binding protein